MPAGSWREKIPSVPRMEKEIHVDPGEEAESLAKSWGYMPYMVERYLRILATRPPSSSGPWLGATTSGRTAESWSRGSPASASG